MLERVRAPSLVSQLGSPSPLRGLVGDREDRIRQPPPERLVVAELLEQLRVVLQQRRHHPPERLVVLDPRVLLVGVLLGVLVGPVGRHAFRDVLRDESVDAVAIGPGDVPELVVEALEDVREAVEFGFRPVAAAVSRNRHDLSILVRQLDVYRRLLLDAVAVHSSVVSPARFPASRSARRTHVRSVSRVQSIFDAIDEIADH